MDTERVQKFLRHAWAVACQDKPSKKVAVEDGKFRLTITNLADAEEICKLSGVPSDAIRQMDRGILTYTWHSWADFIFGEGGLLDNALPNYEMRDPQLHMARLVQRSIEMDDVAMIEAGTGVGKSFAYAAIAMAMNKRIIISTSNKALQSQLFTKDIPFLETVLGEKNVELVVGKKNYACKDKCQDGLGNITIFDDELRAWYQQTTTGNMEEITFSIDPNSDIAIDDYCTGRHCPLYDGCFYFYAKEKRNKAHVLITNHALLALHYLYPAANILPPASVIVVDEAHQLPSYARNAMSTEITFNAITRAMAMLKKRSTHIDNESRSEFAKSIQDHVAQSGERQIGLKKTDVIQTGISLAQELWSAADDIFRPEDIPESPEEKRTKIYAEKVRSLGSKINRFSCQGDDVRWIENEDNLKLVCSPHDVSEFIGSIAGYSKPIAKSPKDCTWCGKEISGQLVYINSEDQQSCGDCIDDVDPLRWDTTEIRLAEWLSQDHADHEPTQNIERTPIIFTSATIAAPDMASFQRECGIPNAMQMIAESPFDYENNALLYCPNGNAPEPNSEQYKDFLVDEIRALAEASNGGTLCLFTGYANMRYCYEALQYSFWDNTVLKQGDYPKMELIRRFTADGNAVLFATKSFWEGVSIEGDPLRMVIIDKIPFEPQTPLNRAQGEALKETARMQGVSGGNLKFYPFNHMAVPRAITELKQGTGRLIRTNTDRGVIAILDPRLRTKKYGPEKILPSLPPAPLTDSIAVVEGFFSNRKPMGEPATSMEIFELLASEEIPF